jgi:hypothetical protein
MPFAYAMWNCKCASDSRVLGYSRLPAVCPVVWFNWSVRSVSFIWLNETNQIDQMNEIDKIDEMDETDIFSIR